MGLLKKLFGKRKQEKESISTTDFVKVLVSLATDLKSINENIQMTVFSENIKKTLRNEIIYLQIFAIEMSIDFCFTSIQKNKIMENFYDLLFLVFEGMQTYTKSNQNLRKIIESGLDRSIKEYWIALSDNECHGNPPLSVGRTFSYLCEYPNDFEITTLGADFFDTYMKNLTGLINKYNVLT